MARRRRQNKGRRPPPDSRRQNKGRRRELLSRWRGFSRAQKTGTGLMGAAAAAAVVWLVNWGMPQLVHWIEGVQPPPESARLFIVDTSSSMSGSLGKRSKFNALVSEVNKIIGYESEDVAYALRTTGGECENIPEWDAPLVGFKSGDGDSVRARLKTVRVGGAGDIVAAIHKGKTDFRHYGAAKLAKSKTIWLFLATTQDGCDPAHIPLGKALANALTDTSAQLSSVDFFMLPGEIKGVAKFKREIEGLRPNITVIPVTTPKQLRTAIVDTARRETVSH